LPPFLLPIWGLDIGLFKVQYIKQGFGLGDSIVSDGGYATLFLRYGPL